MNIIWFKVWRDLAHHKLRTLLAALSIATGIFAFGLALGARDLTHILIAEDKLATNPAQLTFRGDAANAGKIEPGIVKAAARQAGVANAEGVFNAPIRWKLPGETQWRDGILEARQDYTAQQISLVRLVAGNWPEERALAVERQTASYFNLQPGNTIVIKTGERQRQLSLQGTVLKPYVLPPMYGAPATFYATLETATWLTGREGFSRLYVNLDSQDAIKTENVSPLVRHKLEGMGLMLTGSSPLGVVGEFNIDDLQDIFDTIYLILMVLGVLALGLSALLIVNTMNTIMVQQIWQIGVMKVLGGTSGSILRAYLAMAVFYGGLGLALAVLPSALAAQALSGFFLDSVVNIIPAELTLHLSLKTIGLQALVALIVPAAAALIPAISGVRITPHRAINTHGIGLDFGQSRLDQLVSLWRGLPRPLALSLRNAFRRKTRLLLTLLSMALGGVMFIMVMSVNASLIKTVDKMLLSLQYDVMGVFTSPQNTGSIKSLTAHLPGVQGVELWHRREAEWTGPNEEKATLALWGAPLDSRIFHPVLFGGRGFLPGDSQVILLDSHTATRNNIQLGEEIVLSIAGKETHWEVVGLIMNVMPGSGDCFVPYSALANATNREGSNILMTVAEKHDLQAQLGLIDVLNETYLARNIDVIDYRSAELFRQQCRLLFSTLTGLLMIMALLVAVVGGIGLTGTLAINTIERRCEIGMLRAIGASTPALLGIFISEGVFLGVISWLAALPLSFPAAYYFGRAFGLALFNNPLEFNYSISSIGIWLLIVIILSAVSSLGPAIQATRVTVNEALKYE